MYVYRITKASTLEYKYNMHLHSDMHALMPITFVSNDDRHLAIVPGDTHTSHKSHAGLCHQTLSVTCTDRDDNQSLV